MSRATWCNWLAIPVVRPANAGSTTGDALVRIGFTVPERFSAWVPIAFIALTNVFGDDCARRSRSAARRALDADVLLYPCKPKLPDDGTDNGFESAPVLNRTVPPSD